MQARVTLREMGDMASEEGRDELGGAPAARAGVAAPGARHRGDRRRCAAAFADGGCCLRAQARQRLRVMIADCMPVFFTDGTQVAVAHAGWRGLAAGVLEATLEKFDAQQASSAGSARRSDPRRTRWAKTCARLSPATNPLSRRRAPVIGCSISTPWRAQRLKGVKGIYGGDFCTYTDQKRFFSYRRDKAKERMAALIWLTA